MAPLGDQDLGRVPATEHTLKRITGDEQAELEALFARATRNRPKHRPEGRATYERKMFSGYGAAVHRNAVYGHWHLGRKAKLRFVPFKDLSAIYPMELTVRMWWKRRPYDGVQLETSTGLVLDVESMRHDVAAFRAALVRALGTSYAGLYRADEPIRTSIFDGRSGPTPPCARVGLHPRPGPCPSPVRGRVRSTRQKAS